MNLSLRQWTIVAVLGVGFIVAAFLVSGNGSAGPEVSLDEPVDPVAWCAALQPVSTWGGILDGQVDNNDAASDVTNLLQALGDARTTAAATMKPDFARLLDFTMLTDNSLRDGLSVADAVAKAQTQTDQVRVADAVGRISSAVVACGHDPLG